VKALADGTKAANYQIAESSARLRFVGSCRQAKSLAVRASYTIIEKMPIAALGSLASTRAWPSEHLLKRPARLKRAKKRTSRIFAIENREVRAIGSRVNPVDGAPPVVNYRLSGLDKESVTPAVVFTFAQTPDMRRFCVRFLRRLILVR
jgi:hypothetical protein